MENPRSRRYVLALIGAAAACVILAVAGFLAGRKIGSEEASAAYQAEREKQVLWNRSELEFLDGADGTIYVTGHRSPDTDTVCSAILYARLLRELGYDAQAAVLGPISSETKFVLTAAGAEEPPLLEDASGKTVVLVDHSDYLHSADGLQDANVITIIDHHGTGTVTTGNQLIYDARPLGSTATIIGIRYGNYGVEIDSQTAALIVGAVLSDTSGLKSANTTPADLGVVEDLCSLAGIQDPAAFYQEMFRARISYEGKTDEEIFFSDYKEYRGGGKTFGIGCVDAYDEADAREMAERMKKVFPSILPSAEADYLIAQISVFHDDLSMNYFVAADPASAELMEAALDGKAVFDGTSFVLKPGVSRRQVVVPAITAVLEEHPAE